MILRGFAGHAWAAVRENEEVNRYLSTEEIERCFDVRYHLKNLEHTFELMGI